MIHKLKDVLTKDLDPELRRRLLWRYDYLVRRVKHLKANKYSSYTSALNNGWTFRNIEILCLLNSFYHVVLGPLSAVSNTSFRSGIFSRSPIKYGSLIQLDCNTSKRFSMCINDFNSIIEKLGINYWILRSNLADDIIYRLATQDDDNQF